MNQQIQPQQVVLTPSQVVAEWFQYVMPVIMAVWMGAFVVGQVVKTIKGEEIEKPPLTPK